MRKAWKSDEVAECWGVGAMECWSDGSGDCPIEVRFGFVVEFMQSCWSDATRNRRLENAGNATQRRLSPRKSARAEGNALNERNQACPAIECSRHGPVREWRSPVVVEERQTPVRQTPTVDNRQINS